MLLLQIEKVSVSIFLNRLTSFMACSSKEKQDLEFTSIAQYTECESAKVTGLICEVSDMTPTKKGTDYFHATLNDGQKETRVVGFRKRQRDLLKTFEESGDTIEISACKIKKSKYGDDFNVMMANKTEVNTSPKKIKIDKERLVKRNNLKLGDLQEQRDGARISCTVKVLRVEEKAVVSGGQSLQNVIISDSTRANKVVLWNNDIGKLKLGCSYLLKQVMVKSYQDEKFLQLPKQGATIEEVEDIGTVSVDDVNAYEQIDQSEVAAVLSLDDYLVCLSCKNKVQPMDESSGTCTSCGVSQKLSFCTRQLRAKLLLTRPRGEYIQLSAFGDHLKQICGHDVVSTDKLLQAPPFNFTYNQQVINGISRPTSS